jgi:hypothetical protein
MRPVVHLLLSLASGLMSWAATPGVPQVRFELPADAMMVVKNEAAFAPFAKRVAAEVERLLGVPTAVDDPVTLGLLLSTRVHLAHHFADDEKAIATAAWIRSRQTDPASRAFAGLTTLASVAARRANPEAVPADSRYRESFRRAFAGQLAGLPHTPEIVVMLRGQREKIAAITEASLWAETRDVIGPAITRRGECGLAEADQLVRVRHRLVSIVPIRTDTLQALDAAIAARTTP